MTVHRSTCSGPQRCALPCAPDLTPQGPRPWPPFHPDDTHPPTAGFPSGAVRVTWDQGSLRVSVAAMLLLETLGYPRCSRSYEWKDPARWYQNFAGPSWMTCADLTGKRCDVTKRWMKLMTETMFHPACLHPDQRYHCQSSTGSSPSASGWFLWLQGAWVAVFHAAC